MANDIMIDIETLGTTPDAAVLTIGAIRFNADTKDAPVKEIYLKLDVADQQGRITDENTVKWWSEQEQTVQDSTFKGNRISVRLALEELTNFITEDDRVWAHGPQFDMVILESLYKSVDKKAPWKYNKVRDTRTLYEVLGDMRPAVRPNEHNALEDCKYQAKGVQECFAHLRSLEGAKWDGYVDRQGGSFTDKELVDSLTRS